MNRLYYCMFVICYLVVSHDAYACCSSCYLRDTISRTNHRYSTMSAALDLMTKREMKTIVETGTARYGAANCAGDGCSTVIFSRWAKDHQAILYSVDIDPQAIQQAAQAVTNHEKYVQFVVGDSVDFLSNFGTPIDFLYLDSYDYELSNPLPSQVHHYKEIVAALPWLTPNSIVMIDDCDLPQGGKGKLVIEYLKDRGWVVIYSNYQVILVHKSSLL